MKMTYTLNCRNGYGEKIAIDFSAYNILDAKIMAENWMKHNYVHSGWLVTKSGKQFPVNW